MAWLENETAGSASFFGSPAKNILRVQDGDRNGSEWLGGPDNLLLMERGKLLPPEDGDLGLFLISDGKINEKTKFKESTFLRVYFERYKSPRDVAIVAGVYRSIVANRHFPLSWYFVQSSLLPLQTGIGAYAFSGRI